MTTKLTREARQLEINNIARTLKNASTTASAAMKALRDKLALLVLEDKGLASCVCYTVAGAVVEENPKFQYFDDKVFAAAFSYAEKTFGKLDEATGEVIPFMQLFNYAWNLKQGDIYLLKNEESNGFNRSRKKYLMEFFLEDCCKRAGIRRTERFNVLQIDKVEKWLLDNDFGAAEIEKAHTILENSYVVNDETPTADEEQNGYRLSDSTSYMEQGCSDRAVEAISLMAEKAYKAAGQKNFHKMRYLLTLNYVGYEAKSGQSYGLYIDDVFDPELADYIRRHGYPEDKAATLADYLGIKRETARKMLRAMKTVLETLK